MNKNRIYLIVIVVLLVLASVVFFVKNRGGQISGKADRFSTDTATITKIFLAEKNGSTITLEKQKDYTWKVNGLYRARKDVIANLLETIKRVAIKGAISSTEQNNSKKLLSSVGIKVEIYEGDDKVKCFYVGEATQDGIGTTMLMENEEEVFITEIPGFNGYLTPRFRADLNAWRDREIFRYLPDDVAEVKVEYLGAPEASFDLKIIDKDYITLTNLKGDTAKSNVDGEFLRKYSGNLFDVQYSVLLNEKTPINTDTLTTNMFANITVTNRAGVSNKIVLYKIFVPMQDAKGKITMEPSENVRALIMNGKQLVIAQLYVLKDVMVTYQDFFVDNSTKTPAF